MYSRTDSTRTRPLSGTIDKYTKYNTPSSTYTSSYTTSYDRSSREIGRSTSYNSISKSSSLAEKSRSLDAQIAALNLDPNRYTSSNSHSSGRRYLRETSRSRALPSLEPSTPSVSASGYKGSLYLKSKYDRPSLRSYSTDSDRDSPPNDKGSKQGGLKNIGNSCYLNSVLQCILHCEPIKKYLLNKEFSGQVNSRSKTRGRVVESSADLFKSLISGQTASPSSVKAAVSSASGLFRGTAQEDAQEFLRWYLEALHEDVSKGEKSRGYTEPRTASEAWSQYNRRENSRIVDLFVGQLKSSLKCSTCGYVSEVWDPFWDLSVPIPSRARNVRDCLDEFQREEILDGSEKPKCEKCNARRRMTKKFSVEKCPQVLVLHLKRFGDSRGYSRSKICTNIEFPMKMNDFGTNYSLKAVCNHMGGVGGGHYIAYGKTSDGWFEYNDSRVSSISESQVQTQDAYLLFYTK